MIRERSGQFVCIAVSALAGAERGLEPPDRGGRGAGGRPCGLGLPAGAWSALLGRAEALAEDFTRGGVSAPSSASWVDPGLREPGTQFLLANSITLTPGTVTVALHRGRLCVYALDQEFAAGVKDSEFVRRLRRWEGKQDG